MKNKKQKKQKTKKNKKQKNKEILFVLFLIFIKLQKLCKSYLNKIKNYFKKKDQIFLFYKKGEETNISFY